MYNIEGAEWLLAVCGDLAGKAMLELGDQEVWPPAAARFKIPHLVAKWWFMACGVEKHVSVDLNGKHGAVKHDLSKPIFHEGWDEAFDFVTDVGTMEHVTQNGLDGQYHCLANIHRWCKPGGLMLHQLPPVGQWLDHGGYKYDERWAETLADLNGYEIVNMERTKLPTLNPAVEYLSVAFRRPDNPWFTDEKTRLVETIHVP